MKERRKRLLMSIYFKERGIIQDSPSHEQQQAFLIDFQAKEAHKNVVI